MKRPLVSIVVLTYNSEKYILETLDSVFTQDYDQIELIVSDDGSKDNTCNVTDKWIEDHRSRFVNAHLIQSFHNKGTCANYNQGICNSHGAFIKTIDGDDCLNGNNAISRYLSFMQNTNAQICISDVDLFSEESVDFLKAREWYDYIFNCESEDYEKQKHRIVKELAIADPGMFFTRELFDSIGGFSNNYRLLEEWPFFYSILMSGYHIVSLPEKLVRYRIDPNSVSHRKISPTFVQLQKDLVRFYWLVRSKQLLKSGRLFDFCVESIRTTYSFIKSVVLLKLQV